MKETQGDYSLHNEMLHHPPVEAAVVCAVCSKAICQDRAVSVDGRLLCQECYATGSVPTRVTTAPTIPTNRMALTSMLLGLGGWLVWLLLFCYNSALGLLTGGVGWICVSPLIIPLWLIPYIGWIPAVVTGHRAIKQLNKEGNIEGGRGMALTGLISGYLALGLTLITCLLAAILTVAGVSILLIVEIIRQLGR